ncbi:MAG TPA: hypothetical protein VHX39_28780, partial [Acetobacteraceae bacterium]|nr:hypothetical protein [Acetobacteraceae bacterium]
MADDDHRSHAQDRRQVLRLAGMTAASGMVALTGHPVQSASQPISRGPQIGGLRAGMVGFMLPHEQFAVPDLVKLGTFAAHAKFDLLASSDHFQPWQDNEAHSGSAWVTMAAMGAQAAPAWMGTTVTCPTL